MRSATARAQLDRRADVRREARAAIARAGVARVERLGVLGAGCVRPRECAGLRQRDARSDDRACREQSPARQQSLLVLVHDPSPFLGVAASPRNPIASSKSDGTRQRPSAAVGKRLSRGRRRCSEVRGRPHAFVQAAAACRDYRRAACSYRAMVTRPARTRLLAAATAACAERGGARARRARGVRGRLPRRPAGLPVHRELADRPARRRGTALPADRRDRARPQRLRRRPVLERRAGLRSARHVPARGRPSRRPARRARLGRRDRRRRATTRCSSPRARTGSTASTRRATSSSPSARAATASASFTSAPAAATTRPPAAGWRSSGNLLFVSDSFNDRIQRFNLDGSGGAEIVAPGTLAYPRGLTVDGQRLLVADDKHHRIAVFDIGGRPADDVRQRSGRRARAAELPVRRRGRPRGPRVRRRRPQPSRRALRAEVLVSRTRRAGVTTAPSPARSPTRARSPSTPAARCTSRTPATTASTSSTAAAGSCAPSARPAAPTASSTRRWASAPTRPGSAPWSTRSTGASSC